MNDAINAPKGIFIATSITAALSGLFNGISGFVGLLLGLAGVESSPLYSIIGLLMLITVPCALFAFGGSCYSIIRGYKPGWSIAYLVISILSLCFVFLVMANA